MTRLRASRTWSCSSTSSTCSRSRSCRISCSAHPTFRGALEALILFGAVWWAWNYTAWATNWLDPESIPGAVLMIVLMAISLVMSAAIPEAFDGTRDSVRVRLRRDPGGALGVHGLGVHRLRRPNAAQLRAAAGVVVHRGRDLDRRRVRAPRSPAGAVAGRARGRPGGAGPWLSGCRASARRRWRTGRWPAAISPSAASWC